MILGYYPGCSNSGTSVDYEKSTQAVCKALNVELKEIPDWNCCGSTPGHVTDALLSASLSARNLAQAQDAGYERVMTTCPSCLSNLKNARQHCTHADFREKLERIIEHKAENLPDTFGILQILTEDVGIEAIERRVTKPLSGIKIVPYYGCVTTRPAQVMQFDDPERPMSMDAILTALGAEVLPFPLKVECCGASAGIPRKEITARLSARILQAAHAAGADAVAVACPLCQMNLDLRQNQAMKAIEKDGGELFFMPVFYITQLMGLAFELDRKQLGLEKLSTSPDKVLTALDATGGRA